MRSSYAPNQRQMAIVAAALREHASHRVSARSAAGRDPEGPWTRAGWERLIRYFHVAAPGLSGDAVIKHLPSPGANDLLPAWSLIFALWAVKAAGLQIGTWTPDGIAAVDDLDTEQTPEPGDIGYLDQPYHHGIVVAIEGVGLRSRVRTVDGDSGPDGDLALHTRPRASFRSFHAARSAVMVDGPVGDWDVKIGWQEWRYRFCPDGWVHRAERSTPDRHIESGQWRLGNDLDVVWPDCGSREEWDVPLYAAQQGGSWFGADGRTAIVSTRRIRT